MVLCLRFRSELQVVIIEMKRPTNSFITVFQYTVIFVLSLTCTLGMSCSKKPNEPIVDDPNRPKTTLIDFEPCWSPDGQWIVYYHGASDPQDTTGIYRIRVDGTDKTLISALGRSPKWSPEGNQIIYSKLYDFQIHLLNIANNTSMQLTNDDMEKQFPSWCPDSQNLLFSVHAGHDTIVGIWSLHLDSGVMTRRVARWARYPVLNPSGNITAFIESASNTQYLSVAIDSTGEVIRLLDARDFGTWSFHYPSFDNDGSRILFQATWSQSAENKILVYHLYDESVTESVVGGYSPAWSPNGQSVVFTLRHVHEDGVEGDGYLWIMNIEDYSSNQITFPFYEGAK